MKEFLTQFFTWWNGQTLGTRFFTWRHGTAVGEDEYGNRYFKYADPDGPLGERRWVVYNGPAEPSRVPPGWHGWLHHKIAVAPSEMEFRPLEWQQPHQPNITGTPLAYRPKGSILREGERPRATGDYEPWTPR